MEASSIIICWYSTQVKTNDTTCLYVEVIDPISIDFVSSKDYGRIMARKYRISVCKCLLKKLDTYGSLWHTNIFSNKNQLSILFHIAHCKMYKF
jgi:hypothetical protein